MWRSLRLGSVVFLAAMSGCANDPHSIEEAKPHAASQPLDGQDATLGDPADPTERAYFVRLDGLSAVGALHGELKVSDPKAKVIIAARLAELEKSHATFRPLLEASGAKVVGDFRKVVNAFQVMTTAAGARQLAELPGVVKIERSPVYYPTLSTGLGAVQAPAAWDPIGGSFTGQGVRLGIIDSGIDYLHGDLGGSGNPADYASNNSNIIEPGTFPNTRVVGGFDFAGDGYNGANSPNPDPDPLDCSTGNAAQHGTHVSGIAGGNGVLSDGSAFFGPYNASFDPSAFRVAPGVAPQADLYALKVFGCSGGTTLLLQAFEWAVDPNGDNDLSDRLDVVNLSLGTTFSLSSGSSSDVAAKNLHQAGTLLVAAAGNEGDTTFAHGSPASLPEVLSVGASIAVAAAQLQVTSPASVAGNYAALEGSFTAPLSPTGLSGDLVPVAPTNGCSPLTNGAAVAGNIAFVQRGGCAFVEKFSRAEAAGATAVIMVNNMADGIFQMGGDGSSPLPGVMISQADGATLLAELNQGTVTGTLLLPPFNPNDETFAGFLSSRGPTVIDGALKPDISAPGVGVVSANGGSGIEGVANTGTSMASPFAAGAAAVVRQAFPTLEPQQIKALMMSANQPLRSPEGDLMPVAYQGSGRLALADIIDQTAYLRSANEAAVSLSFGHIDVLETLTASRTINVVNLSNDAVTYDLTVERVHPLPGVTIILDPATVTVPAQGTSQTISVLIIIDPVVLGDPDPDPVTGATTGVFDGDGGQVPEPRSHLNEVDGWVVAKSAAGAEARLAFHTSVRAAASRQAESARYCNSAGETVTVPIVGPSSHPSPVVSAFELGALDGTDIGMPASIDLRAVGAATNYATFGGAFEDAEVYFGVAVEGTWRTAALPEVPVVTIEVDIDGDESVDYLLVPEPNSRTSFAFADYLVARSYIIEGCNAFNLESCDRTPYPDRLPLNLLAANTQDTAPFYNGVIILPAFTRSLGLTEEAPSFAYRARSLAPTGQFDITNWVTFDVTAPAVDTAALAPTPGTPVYVSDQDVIAQVAPDATNAKMLLLHHMNAERKNVLGGEDLRRFEVINLGSGSAAPPTLNGPATATIGETITLVGTWTNNSDVALNNVTMELSTTIGPVSDATSTTGTCVGAVCTVASLEPGESIDARAEVLADNAGDGIATAEVTSDGVCPVSAAGPIVVAQGEQERLEPKFDVEAGCGCRVAAGSDGSGFGAKRLWLIGLLGLGLLRRRFGTASSS